MKKEFIMENAEEIGKIRIMDIENIEEVEELLEQNGFETELSNCTDFLICTKTIERIIKDAVEEIGKDVFLENDILNLIDENLHQEYLNKKQEIFEALDLDYRMSNNQDFDIVYKINADISKNDLNEIDYYVLQELL